MAPKVAAETITLIAEIGENHLGDLVRAKKMISEAKHAGADIAKFQSYRGQDVDPNDEEREWFMQVELSDSAHHELLEYARATGIEFLSAPFTIERARLLLEELGLRSVKVASSEITNAALLNYLNDRVDSVYLSTGIADLDEVREAVSRLDGVGDIVVMHCVTQYPLANEDANLRAIATLAEVFPQCRIGYSDHTVGLLAPTIAVALGATVIEKHFTLDRSLPGTDHVLSVLPKELAELRRMLDQAAALLGSSEKHPVEAELEIREFVRARFPKE